MSYQSSDGYLQIDTTDPQFTVDGVTFAIKVRSLQGLVIFSAFEKSSDGQWGGVLDMDGNVTEAEIADPAAYFARFITMINTYLARRFPSQGAPLDVYQLLSKYLTDHVTFAGTPPQIVLK